MTEPIKLPPELQRVGDLLSKKRPEVREMFHYALVLAMIDDEKARIGRTRIESDCEYLTVQTIAGEAFEIK